jgi:hypothetical protein
MYFWWEVRKKETTPPGECFKRLRRLARALDRSHRLAARALQEDIGHDLLKAWFGGTNIPLTSVWEGSFDPTIIVEELKRAVSAVAALEVAARTAAAANAVSPKSGRPPLLPSDCIHGLAHIYRRNTGSKPGRGAGPFASFVSAFIVAVNPPDFNFGEDSVIGAIQNAHRQHTRSMFD